MGKKVFLLIQADVVVVNGKEEVDHNTDVPLAATFDPAVAEIMLAEVKKREGEKNLVFSQITVNTPEILKMLEAPTLAESLLNEIAEETRVARENQT